MNTRTRCLGLQQLLIVYFAVGVTGCAASAQPAPGGPNPTPDSAAPITQTTRAQNLEEASGEIYARRIRIIEELKSLADQRDVPADNWSHEWAGTYYVGDGLGVNVSVAVAPKSGITYTWRGCLGLYDGNHGDLDGTFDDDGDGKPDGLKIRWAIRSTSRYDFDSKKFYFVRWTGPAGSPGRFYLVPEAQLIKLVNNYNQGGYARDAMYTAPRKYDENAGEHPRAKPPAVEGVPQLPPQWAKLLIAEPLDAKVISVSPGTQKKVNGNISATKARVTLDKGRADGLYLGMEARVGPMLSGPRTLTINRLNEHSAEAVYRDFTASDRPATLPAIGEVIRLSEGTSKK